MSSAIREFKEESAPLANPSSEGLIWIDEVSCASTYSRPNGPDGCLSPEGEPVAHRLNSRGSHQRLFPLRDPTSFYSGIAVYQEDEMVEYVGA